MLERKADANALMRIQTARIEALELENNQFKRKLHSVGDEDRFAV